MASENNKKLLILYVLEILKEYSDENHPLKQVEIMKKIENVYGMKCERKSISSNIDSLIDFGFEIVKEKSGCYLAGRELEKSEVQMLVDSVFSNKSIAGKYAVDLSNKLFNFLCVHDRKKYKYIHKSNEVSRTNNRQMFLNIDLINQAIEENKQIAFIYNSYDLQKNLKPRNNGKKYVVNPYFMMNCKGEYYLVCNYDHYDEVANYKLDLITDIEILNSKIKPVEKTKGYGKGMDVAKYINENAYPFGGDTITAIIRIEKDYAIRNVVDWFGKNSALTKVGEEMFANVTAKELAIVYWCLQYGESVELLEPKTTREKIKDILNEMSGKYNA